MARLIRRVFLTFLTIMALIIAIFFAFQVYGFLGMWLIRNQPLADSSSSAKAWLDINQNGNRDSSELPLRGVCTWSSLSPYSYDDVPQSCKSQQNQTNNEGEWSGVFFAGSKGDDIYVFAEAPTGYHFTTPPAVKNAYAKFGLAPDSLVSINQIGTRYDYVSKDIQNEEYKTRLDRILFWGSIILIIALSIISAVKVDEFLIRHDFA